MNPSPDNRPTAASPSLADHDLWRGGYLEAAIVLGRVSDPLANERLGLALSAAWDSAFLFGPFEDRFNFGRESEPIALSALPGPPQDGHTSLAGWAQLPDNNWTVACTVAIRETTTSGESEPLDWLDVCIPLGGLAELDNRIGGYPFDESANCREWLEPLSDRLAEIAASVVQRANATVAFLGFEVSGIPEADSWDGSVPNERSIGYVVPSESGSPTYFPPTEWR